MSIQELQSNVNQKIQDNSVKAITPADVRQALALIINYLESVTDQLTQGLNSKASDGSMDNLAEELLTLTNDFNELKNFVNTPQPAIQDFIEIAPLLTLLSLGNDNVEIKKKVNKILAVLRLKKDIASV